VTHGEAGTVNTAWQASYAGEHLGTRGTHSARRGTRWGMQRRMFGWRDVWNMPLTCPH